MINVFDFCNICTDGTSIKLSFYDIDTRDFIVDVAFNDAKKGAKTLSAEFGYAAIESFYVSADVVCCSCYKYN